MDLALHGTGYDRVTEQQTQTVDGRNPVRTTFKGWEVPLFAVVFTGIVSCRMSSITVGLS